MILIPRVDPRSSAQSWALFRNRVAVLGLISQRRCGSQPKVARYELPWDHRFAKIYTEDGVRLAATVSTEYTKPGEPSNSSSERFQSSGTSRSHSSPRITIPRLRSFLTMLANAQTPAICTPSNGMRFLIARSISGIINTTAKNDFVMWLPSRYVTLEPQPCEYSALIGRADNPRRPCSLNALLLRSELIRMQRSMRSRQ